MEKYFGALPKPMPHGSIAAAYAHMKEKFPDFVISQAQFSFYTKGPLGPSCVSG